MTDALSLAMNDLSHYETIPAVIPTRVESAECTVYLWREPFDYLAAVAADAQRWTDLRWGVDVEIDGAWSQVTTYRMTWDEACALRNALQREHTDASYRVVIGGN